MLKYTEDKLFYYHLIYDMRSNKFFMKDIKRAIDKAVENDSIYWKEHLLQRIKDRGIKLNQILEAFKSYDIITEYSDDKPFPSYLLLGYDGKVPLHIHVITAYIPDQKIWDKDYRRKRNE